MSRVQAYFWPILIAIIFLLLIFGGAVVGLYTDWLWFTNLGYGEIFSKILLTKAALGGVMGLLFFLIIYGNLWYARRIAPPPSPMGLEQQLLSRLGRLARRGIGLVLFLGSIVISIFVGLEAATHWEEWLKYVHSTPFGIADPQFGVDIGFYVFKLPFLMYIYNWLFVALAISTVAAIAIHYADEAIEVVGNGVQFSPGVKAHIGVLIAFMFFLKAWSYRLGMYQLMLGRGSLFDGAGYADVHARIPALWILFVVAIIGGLLVLYNIHKRGLGFAVLGLGLVIGASILIGSLYPAAVEQLSVKPNELEKETPYIKRAIKATQKAYGLDQIAARPFAAESSLSADQIEANDTTIQNIRLWDQDHLQSAYNQIQTINQYYHFRDVDVDRYWLTDKSTGEKRYRQVWLSARELDQNLLPQTSQTWVNLHLQYTYGYGFCMSPVNEASIPEGLPTFFVSDIPPKTTVDLPLDRMGVYFGDTTENYVFVDTSAKEFDYLTAEGTKETTYKSDSGISIGGLSRKLLFALQFQDLNILLNENLKSKSKVLYKRQIEDRVKTLFSFLQFDHDPYLVTANGGLYWMWDGYTITDSYPYSQHTPLEMSDFNYIRNSVKVVVDAYTGEVDAYVIEEPLRDPIIKTYQEIFPSAFKPISKMPAELREHIRYPEDFFRVQTVVYRRYHQTNPTVFYNNSDLWEIAGKADLIEGENETGSMEPYYVIMKLPNGESEEFILMTPFIRAGKANMVSWMCAKCDAADYGKLVLYQFPRDKNVYGPQQVVARARQDTVISEQMSLWGQLGSQVSSGNLLVVPIESSLLYVIPVYLESTSAKIPELKRVIVSLGNKVSMKPTLAEALSDVVGEQVTAPKPTAKAISVGKAPAEKVPAPVSGAAADKEIKRLIDQAVTQYSAAQDAQKRGDWSEYGDQVKALEKTLNELKAKSK